MNRFYFFLLTLSFSSFHIDAQTNSKKPIKECSAPLARQLVEQQALESRSVEETDQRINILLRVADFLWTSDEAAARKFFAEAFQFAQTRFREKGFETKNNKGILMQQPDQRFSVISAIAKRDAEWSKKLSEAVLKELDEDTEKDKRDKDDQENEVLDLISLAARTAKDNPNVSVTLARRTMRYQLASRWIYALNEMAKNNQPLADQIYAELLTNYADAEIFRLLYLSAYPFGNGKLFGVEKYNMQWSVFAEFSPNRTLQRQFLSTFFRRVMQLTAESTTVSPQTQLPETAAAIMVLSDLEPLVAERFPDLQQSFSQAKIHADSIVAGDALQTAREKDEAGKKSAATFDEKLADLEKAEAEGKLTDQNIFNLVRAAKTEANYQQAETWLDKIVDTVGRAAVADYYYFQRSKLATAEKRFEDGKKFALKVGKIEHRAVLFFDIAEAKLKEPLTKLESAETLLEVYQIALKAPDTVEKAQVLLGTAFMYEKVDRYNAFNALSDAIKAANKLDNPNLTTAYISQQIKLKNNFFYISYAVPGFDITQTFYALSKKDFQNTLNYTTSFSDKYLRTLAILATVKDCEKNESPSKQKTKTK